MKPYYTDYVNHIIKTYVNHTYDELTSQVDRTNWKAADCVVTGLPQAEQDVVRAIYSRLSYRAFRPVPVLVNEYCEQTGREFELVMNVIRKVSKRVKKERGL